MSMTKIRQNVEREIVDRVVDALLAAGFALSVFDTEEETVSESTDAAAVKAAMMTTDEDHLHASKDGARFGWVRFIYGNDGWDVINDYSVNLEEVLAPVNAYCDTLAG